MPTLTRQPIRLAVLAGLASFSVVASGQTAKPPDIQAISAILVDGDSGQVLYQHNPDLPRPPASTR